MYDPLDCRQFVKRGIPFRERSNGNQHALTAVLDLREFDHYPG